VVVMTLQDLCLGTGLAAKQSYYLPFVRTNYGKFQGPFIWNSIDNDIIHGNVEEKKNASSIS